MNHINALFTRLIGVNSDQLEAIRDSKLMHHLVFRSMAIVLGCLSFTVAVFTFASELLHYSLFSALVFALVCGFVLLVLERNNIMGILASGDVSRQALVTRVGVISMMFGAAVALAVYAMKDDIDTRIGEKINDTTKTLASDPRYAVRLAAAKATVEQSTKDVERQRQLMGDLSKLDIAHAKAVEAERNECEGNTTKDGVKRLSGCGNRARAHRAEAERIALERTAVQSELTMLGDASAIAATASEQLDTLTTTIKTEAERQHKGGGAQLSALYDLFWTDSSVALILGFYTSLSLLPEILVWSALTKPGVYQPLLQRMQQIETMTANNRLDKLAEKKRDEATHELPLRHVHVPHIVQAPAPGVGTQASQAANDPLDQGEVENKRGEA